MFTQCRKQKYYKLLYVSTKVLPATKRKIVNLSAWRSEIYPLTQEQDVVNGCTGTHANSAIINVDDNNSFNNKT